MGPRNHVLDGEPDCQWEEAIMRVARPTEKQREPLLGVCSKIDNSMVNNSKKWKKSFDPQQQHNSRTAAADCNAPNWSVSHYTPCYAAFHKNSSTTCYGQVKHLSCRLDMNSDFTLVIITVYSVSLASLAR